LVWDLIEQVQPARLITHKFPIQEAAEAYRLLAENPGETIQVAFTY
jgi:threonine dehydrogenase-like Zn-dependent dehydrogenase